MRRELFLGLGTVVAGFAIGCGSGGEHQDNKITPSPIPAGDRFSPAYETPDSILQGRIKSEQLLENMAQAKDEFLESLYQGEIKNPICLRWPIHGPIGSYFGELRVEGTSAIYHTGIDIGNGLSYGDPVIAAADGVVEVAVAHDLDIDWGLGSGLGSFVLLRHGSEFSTLYGHFSKIFVEEGQRVVVGEVIGEVGATGNATGPHVHLEALYRGKVVDPLAFLADEVPECAN